MASRDLDITRNCLRTSLSRASGVKDGDDTSQSIYWTPCGPSLDLHLGLDFSLTNWGFERTNLSLCNDPSIQNTCTQAHTRSSNISSQPAGHGDADCLATPDCQQDTFISSNSGSISWLNTTTSSVQRFPSTASIIRFLGGIGDEWLPSEPNRGFCVPANWGQPVFADSSFDITLEDSPESWGDRKYDELRAPARIPTLLAPYEHSDIVPPQTGTDVVLHGLHPIARSLEPLNTLWTFDEQVTIALLHARMSQSREKSEQFTEDYVSKNGLIATIADRVFSSAKRCFNKNQRR
ncbi:hypothetical protein HYPSUDRAFT_420221 [Hypholoma sublateritium FD-334 SS-4]|uniref:Uncharacterized protein n=1 Tax=Hypholoma sublateritium (strain FD-334 SS-4) TaxID=945553 RepID=A0A0D2LD38_HYPSF|nr:hypothetical protein HYPSUDRAFT_420221 [Hypholoma sublateritium FD-334 SS-4]